MRRAVAYFALTVSWVAVGACSGPATRSTRAGLFPDSHSAELEARLTLDEELAVFYWPAVELCDPAAVAAAVALEKLAREEQTIRVTTIVPKGTRNAIERLGVPYPGETLEVPPRQYHAAGWLVPLPRVEVWSRDGRLMLLKAIPPNPNQATQLGEEIRWFLAIPVM